MNVTKVPLGAVLPPRSNTGVEPGDVSLGWLAGTRPIWDEGDERRTAWDLFASVRDFLPGPTTMDVRSQWYSRGFAADDGSYAVFYEGVGSARGGLMLSVRQGGWERIGPAAALDAMRVFLGGSLRVSRVDLAGDDRRQDGRRTPAEWFSLLPAARSRSRPENRRLLVNGLGEQTMTVGSRTSERYLRCYMKLDRDGVVRHELELKQATAQTAVARILGGASLFDVWQAEYGRLVQWG